jgi:hypothetical protein
MYALAKSRRGQLNSEGDEIIKREYILVWVSGLDGWYWMDSFHAAMASSNSSDGHHVNNTRRRLNIAHTEMVMGYT